MPRRPRHKDGLAITELASFNIVEINPFMLHDKINTLNGLIKNTQHAHESDCKDILYLSIVRLRDVH